LARSRSHTRVVTGGRRRAPSSWVRDISLTGIIVAAGTKTLVTTLALSNPGIGETVRRTRGMLTISSDQGIAIEEQAGAFGMMVVNDVALAAGVGSIPGPSTELGDDGWFLWQGFVQRGFTSATFGTRMGETYHFDSKAMRRVEEGFGIAVVIENGQLTTGLFVQCAFSILTSLS